MNFEIDNSKSAVAKLLTFVLAIASVLTLPLSASATNVVAQQDGARLQTVATSPQTWVLDQNMNGFDALKFSPNSYPFTFSVNVQVVNNSSAVNTSTFTCNLYDGQNQTWGSSGFGVSISTLAADSQSISCQITVASGIQGEFEVGSARTNLNYGRVRFMVVTPQVSGGSGGSGVATPRPTSSKYEGPEILAVDTFRPITAGGKLVFTGKNLSSVTSATIGAKAASLSFDANTGLAIGTPEGLTPGKYDLVMKSSYGTLTHINAVTIKSPTPTASIGFRSEAAHLSEQQVLDLVAFNQTLNPDYEKVRCIVNASDPKVAKKIADLVCAQVARGEARNVEVIKELRNTYPGEGFWVRVYAAG